MYPSISFPISLSCSLRRPSRDEATLMQKNDAQLVVDYLIDGDEAALEKLINRYLKLIYNFVYRLVGSAHEAEDITQDAFVKAWKNLKSYRGSEPFKPWLLKIARNTAIDWMRKRKHLAFSALEDKEGKNILIATVTDPEPLPHEMMSHMEDAQFLENLLKKLSPAFREVLLLHYGEHLTFDEIGKILKKPLDTVKSQHRRALAALKKIIDAPKSR